MGTNEGSTLEAPRTREHLTCPLCGRLAVLNGATLPEVIRDDHALGGKRQTFTGRGRGAGFAWETRELRPEEAIALEEVVSSVASRLKQETGAGAPPSRSREAKLLGEMSQLKVKNEHMRDKLKKMSRLARALNDELLALKQQRR